MFLKKGKIPISGLIEKTKETLRFFKGRVDKLRKSPKAKCKDETAILKKTEEITLVLSAASVAKATLVVFLMVGLIYFLVEIKHVLIIFFVSFLFSAALVPAVDFFESKRIPRSIGVLIVYLVILVLLGVIFSILIPLAASQISDLASKVGMIIQRITSVDSTSMISNKLSPYFGQLSKGIDVSTVTDQIQSALQLFATQLFTLGDNLWAAIKVISNGLINTLLVLVLTFIMTVNRKAIDEFIPSLFPLKHVSYITEKLAAIQKKIGFWVRGQLLLSTIVAVTVFLALTIMGFEYATTIALISFFAELVPVFGPLIVLAFAIPLALNQGFWMFMSVGIFFLILHLVEAKILVLVIMQKVVDVSPLAILFAMLVGAHYLGIVGLILAVPVAAALSIFVSDYLTGKSKPA